MSHDQMLRALAECWNTVSSHTGVKVAPGIMEWLSSSPEERTYWTTWGFPPRGQSFDGTWVSICTTPEESERRAQERGMEEIDPPVMTTVEETLARAKERSRLGVRVMTYDEQEGWIVLAEYPV